MVATTDKPQGSRTEFDRLVPYYAAWRQQGKRAWDAYNAACRMRDEVSTELESATTRGVLLSELLPIVVSVGVIIAAIGHYQRQGGLWITSPSGKTTREVPLRLGLRVMRKRGWHLARVKPVKPTRRISRVEAAKIVLKGDHNGI